MCNCRIKKKKVFFLLKKILFGLDAWQNLKFEIIIFIKHRPEQQANYNCFFLAKHVCCYPHFFQMEFLRQIRRKQMSNSFANLINSHDDAPLRSDNKAKHFFERLHDVCLYILFNVCKTLLLICPHTVVLDKDK